MGKSDKLLFGMVWYGMVWYGNFIYTRYFLKVHLHSSIEKLSTNQSRI